MHGDLLAICDLLLDLPHAEILRLRLGHDQGQGYMDRARARVRWCAMAQHGAAVEVRACRVGVGLEGVGVGLGTLFSVGFALSVRMVLEEARAAFP